MDGLLSLNRRLADAGITLHFSEIKGPVMDQMKLAALPDQLSGHIYLTHYQAMQDLDPECVAASDEKTGHDLQPPHTPVS